MNETAVFETEADRGIDHDWLTLAACAIGLVVSAATVSIFTFGVFIGPISREFRWTRGQISGAVTVGQLSLVVSSLLWGVVLDRVGPRRTLLTCVIGLGVGLTLFATVRPPLWHLYFVFAAIHVLAAAAAPLGYNGILVRRFERRLGLALGIALMGVGLGAAILPALAQHIISAAGWRSAYATMAVLAVGIGLPAAWVATRHAKGPVVRTSGSVAVPLLPLLRTRAFLLICVTFFFLSTAGTGILTHLVPMMTDGGIKISVAAKIAGLVGISTLVSRGLVGWLLDRIHAPYMVAGVALLCGGLCLLLIHGGGAGVYSVAAVLLGFVSGAEIDFISFLLRVYFGSAAFGRLYSVAFAAYALGPGAALIGYSFDHYHAYRPGLLIFAGLSVISALLALALPRYERAERTAMPQVRLWRTAKEV